MRQRREEGEGGGGGERAGGVAGEGDDEAEERGGRGRRFGGNGVGDAAGARSPPLILGAFFLKLSTNTCTRTTAGKRNRQRIIHVHARRTIVHRPARAHTRLYDWSMRALRPPKMIIVPLVTNRHRRIWTVLVFFLLAFSPGWSTGAETNGNGYRSSWLSHTRLVLDGDEFGWYWV